MKKTLKLLFAAVLSISAAAAAFAADSAGQAGAYLKMGVGARALGMGSAFSAVSDDSTGAFWNPAGLARLKASEASFMHANLTLDRDYNFFNYAHVLDKEKGAEKGVAAVSHISFGVDGIPETRESTNSPGNPATQADGTYKAGENVYIFSYFEDVERATFGTYAKKLSKKLYGGLNLKYLQHELFNSDADAWGLDFGLMYEQNEKTTLGLSVRDIGESLKWNTNTGTKDDVPVTTTIGVAYKPKADLLIAADVRKVEGMSAVLSAGAEWWLQDYAALRLGSNDGDMTMGASFKLDTWRFDYSFSDETLGDAHRISASKTF